MKIAIIGGGIAGLSTAYYAQKAFPDAAITLIESGTRLGGKITTETPDGFVIEGGPDSFITQKPAALTLCRELGIEDQMIGTNDHRRKTYILRRGRLREMPDGMMLIVPTRFLPFAKSGLISWWGKLRMGMEMFIPPRTDDADESIAQFMRRRLGSEALEVLGEPMLAGIHVSDAETLSLKASFPRFREIEKKYGSITRGMIAAKKNTPPSKLPMFMTMRGGLKELVAALEKAFKGQVITGQAVTKITPPLDHLPTRENPSPESPPHAWGGGRRWGLTLSDNQQLIADIVVLATPAYISAKLLQGQSDELADLLHGIRYVSTATVSLGYRVEDVQRPLDGFGFVIPRTEPTPLLACTWTSTKFDHRAPGEHVLMRVFLGGPRRDAIVDHSDDELIAIVQAELQKIMGVKAAPVVAKVFRWIKANPQYEVGHLDRVDQMDALCPPGIYLTGSPYRGVGIPDCIQQSQQTVERIKAFVGENVALEELRIKN